MKINWTKGQKIKDYQIWYYDDTDGKRVYNVTKDDNPPENEAGYYSLVYLYHVKGIYPYW